MAANPVELPTPNPASDKQSPAQAGLLGLTASFGTSRLVALTAFFGALGTALAGFQKLRASLGLSVQQCAALVGAILILLFFSHTLPTLLERRRRDRLAQITGSAKAGYFQLGPREDEATFRRADGKHDEVLRWLERPPESVLYLTGSSGTGKSSILAAWALPRLERGGVRIVRLRGYQDPAKVLEEELKRPGVIWKRGVPEISDLNALFEEARKRIHPSRMLVVFDQFEEFLILQEEEHRKRFVEFLTRQASLPHEEATILLVFRAEYDGFIQELKLPTPILGKNLQKVSAFTERAAQEFLLGSGLGFEEQLQLSVLREAAEVEETKGLIRPVTINLCGLVLSRFATGIPRQFRPGRLIRGFVHESIFKKEIRDASPVLLPRLISPQVTKRPQSIADLTGQTELTAAQAQGVMFTLGDPERAIVRSLDSEFRVWEISHDFLVPMIDSMLSQWRVSAWRRLRPWLPLLYLAILLPVLFVARRLVPDPIAELNKQGWSTSAILDEKDGHVVSYRLQFNSTPPSDCVTNLERIPAPFSILLEGLPRFDAVHFGAWSRLSGLTELDLSGNSGMTDISGVQNLHLASLRLSGDDLIPSAALANLPKSLKWLDISGDFARLLSPSRKQITADVLRGLPGSLERLTLDRTDFDGSLLKNLPKNLKTLEISNTKITDQALRDLPVSVTSLDIGWNKITDEGIKNLLATLTSLRLSGNTGITEEGIKLLPRSLQLLDLDYNQRVTDAWLKDLPQSLLSLDLTSDGGITNEGLGYLPKSVTSLHLGADNQITDEGIKRLPPSVKVRRGAL
jgi:hypothetical protein